MWQGVFVLLSVLGADEVVVQPLQGSAVRGALIALNQQAIVIRGDAGEMTIPANSVLSVRPAASALLPSPGDLGIGIPGVAVPGQDTKPPTYQIEMSDGSMVTGERLDMDATIAKVNKQGTAIEISSRFVRSVRWRRPNDTLREQWNALATVAATGDQLVVRKVRTDDPNGGPTTVALDPLEGIVRGISATGVTFEFDGDRINVAWEKVEGVLFHRGATPAWPDPLCRIREPDGTRWQVGTIQFATGTVRVTTLAGIPADIPLDRIAEIDYAAGNLVFVSDLDPESVEWRPFLVTPATPPSLKTWFSVRRDQKIDGSVLTLAGQSYDKGLAIHSRTQFTYRLTREFRHFRAVVGIDERFRGTANLKLVITGDERILMSRDVRGGDEPFELELAVTGVRRLRILVDFGEDRSDAGDHLLLCNARLTK